jgi:hypothetical protein
MTEKTENGFSETRPFTAVFRGLTADEAGEIVNHPKWSAGSWSHALDDRDAARAALSASQPKPLTDTRIVECMDAADKAIKGQTFETPGARDIAWARALILESTK